ncbi:vanadium-dependent haloperoxidase [Methylobrevis sp. L22]|uniref:Vanadium-dependent haloperoxidase n=2 Tax=Methylobrevis albus TaxID=2793297 RepID=A0A931I500_9HYPH|nr:vanadium-dependent haloperoxidase [Methylobrevis albus]
MAAAAVVMAGLGFGPAAAAERPAPETVLREWYGLVLELVRHTPTYSPPVASRAFAYLGVAAFEASVAVGEGDLVSLAGQVQALGPLPAPPPDAALDAAVVVQATVAAAARELFGNTGPTGQRALKLVEAKLAASVADGLPAATVTASTDYGRAIAAHVLAWSADDGGAVIDNMGFPADFALGDGPGRWKPTSTFDQQQRPLLPRWGENRTFAMPSGATCDLPPPPDYSDDPASRFFIEAKEVYDARVQLSDEHRAIARFWSDDPMLSPTPPGHWISIALQLLEQDGAGLDRHAEVMAKLGITLADAFIGCWHEKFRYDLVRPVTVIRRMIDPKWEPLLITPPFPEYPSGHSTQSGAAAEVLTALFGENRAFTDRTHEDDGLPARSFPSLWAAAEEAGISRLYGGIHFRAAIDLGLDQGRCIGAYAAALRTRK